MDLEFHINPKDLATLLYWQDEDDVLTLIKWIDRRWAECDFKLNLLNHFADALRQEGYTINLEIKEP